MIVIVEPNYARKAEDNYMTLGSLLYGIACGVIGALKIAVLTVLKFGRWVWDKAHLV